MKTEKTENQPTPADKPPAINYSRYFGDRLRKQRLNENQPEFAVTTYEHPAYVRPQ